MLSFCSIHNQEVVMTVAQIRPTPDIATHSASCPLGMRGLSRILRPAPQHDSVPDNPGDIQPGDGVEVDSPSSTAAAATHPCLKLPIAVSRFVRRVVQRLRDKRNGFNDRRDQRTSATSDVDVKEQCWCCHLANCLRGGMRRLVTSLTQPNTAESKCRTPECKWFKAGCTRIYLIIVNLASFVSVTPFLCRINNKDNKFSLTRAFYHLSHNEIVSAGRHPRAKTQ